MYTLREIFENDSIVFNKRIRRFHVSLDPCQVHIVHKGYLVSTIDFTNSHINTG